MLVVAAGGYSPSPTKFHAGQATPRFAQELLNQGYAYAETGYSNGGLAIAEAVADVQALRVHFIGKHGPPRRTFVVGESKGGLVALMLMETAPSEFDGALAVSGLLSSPHRFLERAFGLLDTFARDFPSVLPTPEQVPPTYVADEQIVRRVLDALRANASAASLLRAQASVRRDEDLAELLAFHTDALRDLQSRCGGNPFVNDSKAAACARSLPAPTGVLARPFLALDAAYDPVIPDWSAAEYLALVRKAGQERLFAREVVPEEGHIAARVADRVRAFAALVRWSAEGVRPPSQ